MSFNDTFRLSAHGVLVKNHKVLQLKATYGKLDWGLPGGALEPGETIHQALLRECEEELGFSVQVEYLSGVYYHSHYNSQVFIFKVKAPENYCISLSSEHSEFDFFAPESLNPIQNRRILDCINFDGMVKSEKF